MIRLPGVLEDAGLGARMLLQVHDELLFEVPDEELAETAAAVARAMEEAAHLSVPSPSRPAPGEAGPRPISPA